MVTTRLQHQRQNAAASAAARNAALRVIKTRKNAARHAAARIIQRAWKGALLEVPGKGPIHRSRVVRHLGGRYDARRLHFLASLHDSEDPDATNQWPTGVKMTNGDAARIIARGNRRKSPPGPRAQMVLGRMRAALAAYHKGPNAFRPYRDAGWRIARIKLMKFDPDALYTKMWRVDAEVELPLKTSWTSLAYKEWALRVLLGKFVYELHMENNRTGNAVLK